MATSRKPSARGTAQAEIARLTAALVRIKELADLQSTTGLSAGEALGGIRYVASNALVPS